MKYRVLCSENNKEHITKLCRLLNLPREVKVNRVCIPFLTF